MPDIFISNKTDSNSNHNPAKIKTLEIIEPDHIHLLSSFCRNPANVSFQNQEHDEKILLFLRRHFITNVPWIIAIFILALIPFILLFLNSRIPDFFVFNIPNKFITIIIIFYYLIVFAYAFISFISWYYNISIVTQKRVVDIDFSDIVYHDVAMTKLNLIEDVNYTQTGFIRSFFNYGDAFVQTAGENLHFDFLAIPKPAKAVEIIESLIGRVR